MLYIVSVSVSWLQCCRLTRYFTDENQGNGGNEDLSWWPTKVNTFDELHQNVVDTSASKYFSLALTESGRVYAFGAGFQGRSL